MMQIICRVVSSSHSKPRTHDASGRASSSIRKLIILIRIECNYKSWTPTVEIVSHSKAPRSLFQLLHPPPLPQHTCNVLHTKGLESSCQSWMIQVGIVFNSKGLRNITLYFTKQRRKSTFFESKTHGPKNPMSKQLGFREIRALIMIY